MVGAEKEGNRERRGLYWIFEQAVGPSDVTIPSRASDIPFGGKI